MKVTLYIDGEHNTVEVKDKIKSVLPDAHYMIFHPAESKGKVTEFDRIKNMSVEEMAEFLKSMVDENETHEVACYGCINYGTHHSNPKNKGTNLYECDGCSCEGIGHDLVKWLESEVETE